MTPTHQHDCPHCRFQATVDGLDWYVCEGPHPTVLGRYGEAGADYVSIDTTGLNPGQLIAHRLDGGLTLSLHRATALAIYTRYKAKGGSA